MSVDITGSEVRDVEAEMARMTDAPAPAIESVYAPVKLLNKVTLVKGAGVRVAAQL